MTLELREDFKRRVVASAGHFVAERHVAGPQSKLIAGGDEKRLPRELLQQPPAKPSLLVGRADRDDLPR